jgi:hypothetical protein
MARAGRVRGHRLPAGHAILVAQGGDQLVDRRRVGEVAGLVDQQIVVAVTLIPGGVGVALQEAQLQPAAPRELPEVPLRSPDGADRVEQFVRPAVDFVELVIR